MSVRPCPAVLGHVHKSSGKGGLGTDEVCKQPLARAKHIRDRNAQTRECTAVAFNPRSRLDQNMAVHDVGDGKQSRWSLLGSLKFSATCIIILVSSSGRFARQLGAYFHPPYCLAIWCHERSTSNN